jgi:murein DD-endopeptidase MepM/ murein hydrolase activator NlpD
MPRFAESLCARRTPQVALLALISFAFAGCSADMSSRVSQAQNSISNPFAQSEATGSVPPQPPQPIERRDQPQYSRPQASYPPAYQSSGYQSSGGPPVVAAPVVAAPLAAPPQPYPSANAGVSGGGRGVASYTPPPQPRLETTGSVPPRSVAAAHPQGGVTIIVGTSDTLEILAQRYHVAPAAIIAANGYRGPRTLSPGQQLIIPRPAAPAAVAVAPVAAPPALTRPVAVATAAPSVHVVNPGDSLLSIAHHNHVSVRELARANGLEPSAKLRLGLRLNVPSARTAAMAPAAAAPALAAAPPPALAPAAGPKLAAAGPQQSARLAQASPAPEDNAAETPVKTAEATGALPTFRWPVRGKVITSYGAKTNGKSNDGINLAVPEGTPVKAAEDGVVAYAGNELKGYGNLVLVRHANGYVTAYAHASELLVKRGDPIKRGQVIAKSGQSGEVASPQLHFEIRKGSSPVDPLQFLNGA